MTTTDRTPSRRSPRSARRALTFAGVVLAACTIASSSMPAGAAFGRATTTTTRKATTTTTKAGTTTTKASTTTTTKATTTTTTTAPTTTTTLPQGCAGLSPEKPDGSAWECTFSDEFSGSTLDRSKWTPVQTKWTGITSWNECYVDDPDNVYVEEGNLNLTARMEETPVDCLWLSSRYTTGAVTTQKKFNQTYGRYEIRAKFPDVDVAGLHGAIWMWPENPLYGIWPLSGEIDIAEVFSALNDRAFATLHYNGSVWGVSSNWNCMLDPTEWHTYTLEWKADGIRILYDGNVCIDDPVTPAIPLLAPAPFDHPFFMALQLALGGAGTPNAFSSATPLPATMQVDYVRVWK